MPPHSVTATVKRGYWSQTSMHQLCCALTTTKFKNFYISTPLLGAELPNWSAVLRNSKTPPVCEVSIHLQNAHICIISDKLRRQFEVKQGITACSQMHIGRECQCSPRSSPTGDRIPKQFLVLHINGNVHSDPKEHWWLQQSHPSIHATMIVQELLNMAHGGQQMLNHQITSA